MPRSVAWVMTLLLAAIVVYEAVTGPHPATARHVAAAALFVAVILLAARGQR